MHNGTMPSRQSGQALVLDLLLLLASTLGLVFLFSAGQVLHSRQRLDNAADAAAYSAAVWRARALNFIAYSNRAIIAQEVAVAQAVTLASWSRYFETFAETAESISRAYPPLIPVMSAIAEIAEASRRTAVTTSELETGWRAGPVVGYKALLLRSQAMLHRSADTFGLGAVANEVARANDSRFFAFAMSDAGAYEAFTRVHASHEDRLRTADIVRSALDPFTTGPRELDLPLPLPSSCIGRTANPDHWVRWYRKRGGTTLSADLDRWEADDTGSMHDWRSRRFFSGCNEREQMPIGWGVAAAGEDTGTSADVSTWGRAIGYRPNASASKNPAGYRRAINDAGGSWDDGQSYDGIARIRELAYDRLGNPAYPSSRVAVLARMEGRSVRTARAIGAASGRLSLTENFAGNRIWSVSTGEVFFRPPPAAGGRIEYASLLTPYWQARLVEPDARERAAAQSYVDR